MEDKTNSGGNGVTFISPRRLRVMQRKADVDKVISDPERFTRVCSGDFALENIPNLSVRSRDRMVRKILHCNKKKC